MGPTLGSAAQSCTAQVGEKASQKLAALCWTELSEALGLQAAFRPHRRLNLLYMTVAEKTWIRTQEALECQSLPGDFCKGSADRTSSPPEVGHQSQVSHAHTPQWVKANQLLSGLPHYLPFEVCFERAFRCLVSVVFSLLNNENAKKRSLMNGPHRYSSAPGTSVTASST